jgi:hypothetical protein
MNGEAEESIPECPKCGSLGYVLYEDRQGARSEIRACSCGYLNSDRQAARLCYAHALMAHGRRAP